VPIQYMQYLETNQNNQFNLLLKSDYYEKALSPSYYGLASP